MWGIRINIPYHSVMYLKGFGTTLIGGYPTTYITSLKTKAMRRKKKEILEITKEVGFIGRFPHDTKIEVIQI